MRGISTDTKTSGFYLSLPPHFDFIELTNNSSDPFPMFVHFVLIDFFKSHIFSNTFVV